MCFATDELPLAGPRKGSRVLGRDSALGGGGSARKPGVANPTGGVGHSEYLLP